MATLAQQWAQKPGYRWQNVEDSDGQLRMERVANDVTPIDLNTPWAEYAGIDNPRDNQFKGRFTQYLKGWLPAGATDIQINNAANAAGFDPSYWYDGGGSGANPYEAALGVAGKLGVPVQRNAAISQQERERAESVSPEATQQTTDEDNMDTLNGLLFVASAGTGFGALGGGLGAGAGAGSTLGAEWAGLDAAIGSGGAWGGAASGAVGAHIPNLIDAGLQTSLQNATSLSFNNPLLRAGANTLLGGGDLGDFASSAAGSLAGGFVGPLVGGTTSDLGPLISGGLSSGAAGGVNALIRGGDPLEAALLGGGIGALKGLDFGTSPVNQIGEPSTFDIGTTDYTATFDPEQAFTNSDFVGASPELNFDPEQDFMFDENTDFNFGGTGDDMFEDLLQGANQDDPFADWTDTSGGITLPDVDPNADPNDPWGAGFDLGNDPSVGTDPWSDNLTAPGGMFEGLDFSGLDAGTKDSLMGIISKYGAQGLQVIKSLFSGGAGVGTDILKNLGLGGLAGKAGALIPIGAALKYAQDQPGADTSLLQENYNQFNPDALAGAYDYNTGQGRGALTDSLGRRQVLGSSFGDAALTNYGTQRDVGRGTLLQSGLSGRANIAAQILAAQQNAQKNKNDLYGRGLLALGNVFGGKG